MKVSYSFLFSPIFKVEKLGGFWIGQKYFVTNYSKNSFKLKKIICEIKENSNSEVVVVGTNRTRIFPSVFTVGQIALVHCKGIFGIHPQMNIT